MTIRNRDEVKPACVECEIPEHMHDGVERYLFDRVEGGSFFNAVVTNNLVHSISSADQMNLAAIKNWARLLYWEFPSQAWGSEETVHKWLHPVEDENG